MERMAENEMEILEEQLADGTITNIEYNEAMKDIEREMRDFYRR